MGIHFLSVGLIDFEFAGLATGLTRYIMPEGVGSLGSYPSK
jgi:hypothetical protein